MASPSQSNFINSAVLALTLAFFSIAAFEPVITKLFHVGSRAYAAQQLLAHVFPPVTSSTKDYQHPKASEDHLWQEAETTAPMGKQTERSKVPVSYRLLRLNRDALIQLLNPTPMELTATRNVITLPMPEGKLARFHFEESPIMGPGLAAQFPEIKTYHGQGVDDPTASARFDWTPAGFHAMSLSVHGTVMVEPFSKEDANTYICYYKAI